MIYKYTKYFSFNLIKYIVILIYIRFTSRLNVKAEMYMYTLFPA